MEQILKRADILLPREVDMSKWSVIACDQFTSEPEYWERVRNEVGEAPSTLKLTLPEAYLEGDGVDARIAAINAEMTRYLDEGLFATYPQSYLLTERTQRDGRVRYGVIGAVDLAAYDYNRGAQSPVRATEGTVLSRIPPRVRVRKDAPLELPHIMLLVDDPEQSAIEVLAARKDSFELLYDFELMERSGHLRGWLVPPAEAEAFERAIDRLAEAEEERVAGTGRGPLLFAVGDGNHSLATAKECYERHGGSRYALCELCNLHSPALDFEPIHRVVFDVDVEALLSELRALCGGESGQTFAYLAGEERGELTFSAPVSNLTVGSLQAFLDRYLEAHGGRCDYIHGEEAVEKLSAAPGCIGFFVPGIDKSELFPSVKADGALPRKTFSMGHAWDKRFYTEAARIR